MMSTVTVGILSGLLMGMAFGFALEKSRVFEPGMIVGQMQLRNWIMLKVFLSAVATGAVVLAVLHGFRLHQAAAEGGALCCGHRRRADPRCRHRTCRCACPGTTLAQIGVGYRDAIFTLLGGLSGAVAFSYAQPWLAKTLIGTGPKLIFTDIAGISYWQGALALAAAIVIILMVIEKAASMARRSWRGRRWQRFGKGTAAA